MVILQKFYFIFLMTPKMSPKSCAKPMASFSLWFPLKLTYLLLPHLLAKSKITFHGHLIVFFGGSGEMSLIWKYFLAFQKYHRRVEIICIMTASNCSVVPSLQIFGSSSSRQVGLRRRVQTKKEETLDLDRRSRLTPPALDKDGASQGKDVLPRLRWGERGLGGRELPGGRW